MATESFSATLRTATGKGASRKLRAAGLTPGLIYRGGDAPTQISFSAPELEKLFARTRNPNTLVALDLGDGKARPCLTREVQRNPLSQAIEHVDFYEIVAGQPVTVSVPLQLVGRAAGTRVGGTLNQLRRRVTVRCAADNIPATIDVDVSPLEIGQSVRASQIVPPEGVTLTFVQDFNVAAVIGKRGAGAEAAGA